MSMFSRRDFLKLSGLYAAEIALGSRNPNFLKAPDSKPIWLFDPETLAGLNGKQQIEFTQSRIDISPNIALVNQPLFRELLHLGEPDRGDQQIKINREDFGEKVMSLELNIYPPDPKDDPKFHAAVANLPADVQPQAVFSALAESHLSGLQIEQIAAVKLANHNIYLLWTDHGKTTCKPLPFDSQYSDSRSCRLLDRNTLSMSGIDKATGLKKTTFFYMSPIGPWPIEDSTTIESASSPGETPTELIGYESTRVHKPKVEILNDHKLARIQKFPDSATMTVEVWSGENRFEQPVTLSTLQHIHPPGHGDTSYLWIYEGYLLYFSSDQPRDGSVLNIITKNERQTVAIPLPPWVLANLNLAAATSQLHSGLDLMIGNPDYPRGRLYRIDPGGSQAVEEFMDLKEILPPRHFPSL